jgi:hypothetical protein
VNGTFEDGTFEDGTFVNGTFEDGIFEDGCYLGSKKTYLTFVPQMSHPQMSVLK